MTLGDCNICTDPKIFNGVETSCRECDQCVATYKNTWVSRCVAEKNTMPHAFAITLTYADVDGVPPLGARVYRYKDVSNMMKRIRSAGKRKWKKNIELRYVIVGEKGTRFGRCHYHGVVFSSHPITELGEISSRKGSDFAYKQRLNWSLWGHGFIEFQKADRMGMSYVLKYILKSRMTAARSRGQKREGKTEWLASSYLWCSKIPSIGETWLWRNLNDLNSKGMCPASLRLRVAGGGDWYVSGELQKQMCLYIHHANVNYQQARGRDLSGYKTLVGSCSKEIENLETGEISHRKPWEWLNYGEEKENEDKFKAYTEAEVCAERLKYEEDFRHKQAFETKQRASKHVVRRCGNIAPCDHCAETLTSSVRASIHQEFLFRYEEWCDKKTGNEEPDYIDFKRWWLTRLRPSRYCQFREGEITKESFQKVTRAAQADPEYPKRKGIYTQLQKQT